MGELIAGGVPLPRRVALGLWAQGRPGRRDAVLSNPELDAGAVLDLHAEELVDAEAALLFAGRTVSRDVLDAVVVTRRERRPEVLEMLATRNTLSEAAAEAVCVRGESGRWLSQLAARCWQPPGPFLEAFRRLGDRHGAWTFLVTNPDGVPVDEAFDTLVWARGDSRLTVPEVVNLSEVCAEIPGLTPRLDGGEPRWALAGYLARRYEPAAARAVAALLADETVFDPQVALPLWGVLRADPDVVSAVRDQAGEVLGRAGYPTTRPENLARAALEMSRWRGGRPVAARLAWRGALAGDYFEDEAAATYAPFATIKTLRRRLMSLAYRRRGRGSIPDLAVTLGLDGPVRGFVAAGPEEVAAAITAYYGDDPSAWSLVADLAESPDTTLREVFHLVDAALGLPGQPAGPGLS